MVCICCRALPGIDVPKQVPTFVEDAVDDASSQEAIAARLLEINQQSKGQKTVTVSVNPFQSDSFVDFCSY